MHEYSLVRSNRRTLAIQVTRDCRVVVKAPRFLSASIIEKFVVERSGWIEKTLERQQKHNALYAVDEARLQQLRAQAKEVLPQRVALYSQKMGLTPTAVKINAARTRFGSCNAKNGLNFSAYLMLFPMEAVDYVVVHELAHIQHRNHGCEFYRLIAEYLPDYKQRIALLKKL